MEEISANYFEQVLNSTVRMIRGTWNMSVCLFMQADDQGMLRIRASDGLTANPKNVGFKPGKGLVAQCLANNEVLESGMMAWDDGMEALLRPTYGPDSKKFICVPVAGQSRTLGVLI